MTGPSWHLLHHIPTERERQSEKCCVQVYDSRATDCVNQFRTDPISLSLSFFSLTVLSPLSKFPPVSHVLVSISVLSPGTVGTAKCYCIFPFELKIQLNWNSTLKNLFPLFDLAGQTQSD